MRLETNAQRCMRTEKQDKATLSARSRLWAFHAGLSLFLVVLALAQ